LKLLRDVGIVSSLSGTTVMSEDLVVAILLCALSFLAIIVAAVFAFKQKVYFDPQTQAVTDIEVPGLGKLKTNTPAIALCFLGVVLGYFAYDGMKGRQAKLVQFQGEVMLDQSLLAETNAIAIGMTSGAWSYTATPNGADVMIPVTISVPNSWPSYMAYAFLLDRAGARPAIIGARLEDAKFRLRMRP
jgi:hypothetical protein